MGSGRKRVAGEEGGKPLGQAARVFELGEVRGAGENHPLGVREPFEHPLMDFAETVPEHLTLPTEDAEHRLGDLPRLRRVEVPGQQRRDVDLEPGPRVGHRLGEGARHRRSRRSW